MKKLQAPLIGFLILLSSTGCKKEFTENKAPEVSEQSLSPASNDLMTTKSKSVSQSIWQKDLAWSQVDLPTHTIYYTNISADISNNTSDQGLVRVFKTSEAKDKTVSLPFEETINGLKNYYYYQVIEGNIMIAIDVYGTKINPAQKSLFKTVIFNETSITDLEKTGKNKVDLMNLPYNDVINLNIK